MLASVLQAASPSALRNCNCRRFARATIDVRGRRVDICTVIGTPPRISTEATRATPPLVRGQKQLLALFLKQLRREREMIKGVIIVNNLGVVRLAKFYEQVHVTGESAEQAQQSVIKKICSLRVKKKTRSARGRARCRGATSNSIMGSPWARHGRTRLARRARRPLVLSRHRTKRPLVLAP